MKRIAIIFICLLVGILAFAQKPTGGVKGTVVSRDGRAPIAGAELVLTKGEMTVHTQSLPDGSFLIEGLEDGMYDMVVTADDFAQSNVNVTVDKGFVKDLIFVSLLPVKNVEEVDDSNFAEFDLMDSGYSDTPTILFNANDVYTSIAGYGFSAIRFKNRGYESQDQNVLLNGVLMNDALTGYSPYSLWSGLNEATRSKETTIGLEASSDWAGAYDGVTNILANPSDMRRGWRFSALSNSALYRLRLMASYASGEKDNGWSYSFNVSTRMGGNDWVQGVYYKSFSYYAGVEKNWNDRHRLFLYTFAAPGERGTQNASTQEVYDLMNDNLYNSNWGYQNGKVRNSRVRKTFEPVTTLQYRFTPSTNFSFTSTLLWRTGKNGYTALDWYDAPDPRPDYYRNLPSYYFMDDDDYNRTNEKKAAWATEMWSQPIAAYSNYQHVNWDRMYNVNYNSAGGRSKYAQEERRVDQNDFHFNNSFKTKINDNFNLSGGLSLRFNRTENYKMMADLLGGQYFLNVDQFAERDYGSIEALNQNDLDYYLKNGYAQKLKVGDKYGYDYYAHIQQHSLWVNGNYNLGLFDFGLAGSVGYQSFYREGLVRKGLFAGLDENGNEIIVDGRKLTTYDKDGKVISSLGKSEVSKFLTYSVKGSVSRIFLGGHRVSANVGYFSDAPTFNQSFMSPRTRNSLIPDLRNKKSFSADLNYQYSNKGYNIRVTGFYTTIKDQTDLMSFYDDSQNSFTNFAMSGIDQRNMGIELGAKIPLPVDGLSVSGVLSLGNYVYTSTPHMVQTIDNSASIVRDEDVIFWQSHPVYKKVYVGGKLVYDVDTEGNPIVESTKKHHISSTPELASQLSVNYKTKSYWFFELNGQYFANAYLDMNPVYRTKSVCSGADGIMTPAEVEGLAAQEQFPAVFLMNCSIGKSWYIHRKYNFGFSLEGKNLLNNLNVKTGGYEQTRVIKSSGKDRYYAFDPKYFYMCGVNYMLNLYFRF